MTPLTDASCPSDFFNFITSCCTANQQQLQCLLLLKQIMDGFYLAIFQYTAAVNFIQQFAHTSFSEHVILC